MTPIGLEQRVRRGRVRSEAARGLGRAWRVRAPVACVSATTAYTDANRASGEQQCNLQKVRPAADRRAQAAQDQNRTRSNA